MVPEIMCRISKTPFMPLVFYHDSENALRFVRFPVFTVWVGASLRFERFHLLKVEGVLLKGSLQR
jgi:hypothetical protein